MLFFSHISGKRLPSLVPTLRSGPDGHKRPLILATPGAEFDVLAVCLLHPCYTLFSYEPFCVEMNSPLDIRGLLPNLKDTYDLNLCAVTDVILI